MTSLQPGAAWQLRQTIGTAVLAAGLYWRGRGNAGQVVGLLVEAGQGRKALLAAAARRAARNPPEQRGPRAPPVLHEVHDLYERYRDEPERFRRMCNFTPLQVHGPACACRCPCRRCWPWA